MIFGNKVAKYLGFLNEKYLIGEISVSNRLWRIMLTIILVVPAYLPFGLIALVNNNLSESQRHNVDIFWFFMAFVPVYFSLWLRNLSALKRLLVGVTGFIIFFVSALLSSFVKTGLYILLDGWVFALTIMVPMFFIYFSFIFTKFIYKKTIGFCETV